MTPDRMDPRVWLGNDDAYSKVYDREGQWVGIYWWHQCSACPAPGLYGDGLTPTWIQFAAPDAPPPTWETDRREPLTLQGSLLCTGCRRHGWIRNGCWEPA